MRLLSFTRNGKSGFGAVTVDGIVDLTAKIGGAATLKALLEQDGLARTKTFLAGRKADFGLNTVVFLPAIPSPAKIICVGLNYVAHAAEASTKVGDYPVIFHRYADSLVAHGAPLIRPKVSTQHDYEGELAVVMGRAGKHIPKDRAMEHVAGYTCFNDSSIRDWQFHTNQYGMGKNFEATGGFGPWMVTADEIPDYRVLKLETFVSGERLQQGNLSELAFDVPTLISYVSQAVAWQPGDVLVTGTPAGVGFTRNPPRFLRHGDTVQIKIDRIGTLENPVIDES
jgi:2-keto-4-pentenoate hydratase/2-oxohepta-3-ene-1,7-dioic acid hydratase in catechol pathway